MNHSTILILLLLAFSLAACGGAEERKQTYLERGKELLQKKNYEKAQIEFKNVLQIDPKSADGWYYLGKSQENQRKYREAMGAYGKVLEMDANYHLAKTGSARILLFAGATDKALELTQQVLAQAPDDAEALVVHAGALHQTGQSGQALLEVQKVLAALPDDLAALAMLSRIYLDADQYDKAEALLVSALQRNNDDELRMLLIQVYADTRKMADAIPHLQHLIRNSPDNLDYRNRLAIFYDASGQVAQAEIVLKTAVSDLPDNMAAKVSLIQFLAQKRDVMTAHTELNKFIAADEDNADLKLLSAQLHLQNKDIPAAEKIWREIMVTHEKELPAAQARMELIRLMLRDEKRLAEVKSELATLMKDNPAFSDGMQLRGNLALNEGRYEEAINDFRALLKDQPTAVPVIRQLATAFLASGKPELAEEQMKMALSQSPRDPQLYMQLAQILQSRKDFVNAARYLELAQKLDSQSLAASEMLFRNYLAQNDYASANALADAIIREHAESTTGYFMKGMLLQAQNKNAESIAHLERALSKNPTAIEPLNLLVRAALTTGKPSMAIDRLQSVIKQHPEHHLAQNLLGEVLLQQKQYDQAQPIFTDITTRKPAWWIGWRNLAQTELMRKQTGKAVDSYRRGITASGDERLVIALALLHEQLQHVDDAVTLYEETLKRTPGSVAITNNLALLLAEKRQDRASRDRALQLVKPFETSDSANSLDTLGWVHYQRGEYDLAIKALMQSDKIAPGQLVTQYHLAAAYFGKGDHAQARNYLQIIINAEPAMAKRPDVAKMMDVLKMAG